MAFGALLINSAYLAASASPSLFYFSNILLHIALGVALAIAVCVRGALVPQSRNSLALRLDAPSAAPPGASRGP